MKEIQLTQGKVALVDDADYEWLNQFKWYALLLSDKYWYARRSKRPVVLMHRLILNPPEGMDSDHINRNGLDNRRSNLRVCTRSQNQHNSISKGGKSKYKGVYLFNGKWGARIMSNYNNTFLGCFNSEIEAAEAYNRAAIKYHGEFARLNEIKGQILTICCECGKTIKQGQLKDGYASDGLCSSCKAKVLKEG